MQTKKHNKKYNKRTLSKSFGGGLSDEVNELKEKPSYMKHTLIMLGISTCYIFLKLTKG